MVDNVELDAGVGGGPKIATDDDGVAQHQYVKAEFGPDNTQTKVTALVGFPVAPDESSADAFGRQRISNPTTLFESKLLAGDKQPLFWDESLELGAGITASTPTAAKPYIDFASTLNTAGKFTRQTFIRLSYQPGKSQLICMTGVLALSGGGAGVERRIGYFDDDNGLFFEDDAGVVGVTVRSNDTGTPIDTTVVQTNWNVDVLDGSGSANNPSGLTVDFTKAQIFSIDFQWLAVGRVRFGLQINGKLRHVHEFNFANLSAIPWASTPNLPLRYQMVTTASSPASTMRVISSVVIAEGGEDMLGLTHSHATVDHVNANVADVIYALVGARLKSAQVGCLFRPFSVSVVAETNDQFEWQLIHNPTVAGVFAFSDKADSCVQVATGDTANPSTNTITGGTVITRGFGTANDALTLDLQNSLSLGVAIDGTLDIVVLAIRPLGANADIQGALIWREIP